MEKLFILIFIFVMPSSSQESTSSWRIESGITFSHFQQQIKQAVGDVRGERLTNEFELGVLLSGSFRIHQFVHLGIFTRADRGERFLARFNGFDAQGKTQTKDGIGGTYTEFWIGPIVQLQWKQLTFDLGYAPYGTRLDNARGDISNASGSTDGSFSLNPTIAWLFSLGGSFSLVKKLAVLIKIEYRPRYYSKRGGEVLSNNIEHGTQSIAPIIGVAYQI